jgi:hypothetical protein
MTVEEITKTLKPLADQLAEVNLKADPEADFMKAMIMLLMGFATEIPANARPAVIKEVVRGMMPVVALLLPLKDS